MAVRESAVARRLASERQVGWRAAVVILNTGDDDVSAGLHIDSDALVAVQAGVQVVPTATLVVPAMEVKVVIVWRCVYADGPGTGPISNILLEVNDAPSRQTGYVAVN